MNIFLYCSIASIFNLKEEQRESKTKIKIKIKKVI